MKKIIFTLIFLCGCSTWVYAQESGDENGASEIKGETVFCSLSCKTNKETCLEVCEVQGNKPDCVSGCNHDYEKCIALCKDER